MGETRVPATADQIADALGLTEDEQEEMLHSGKQRLLHNRVHWAKFYMSKAGLIESPKRCVFTASPAGKDMLATKPPRITDAAEVRGDLADAIVETAAA